VRVGFDTGILGHRCGVMYVFRACGCFLSFISHILTVGWTSLLILLLHVWDERIALPNSSLTTGLLRVFSANVMEGQTTTKHDRIEFVPCNHLSSSWGYIASGDIGELHRR
jgi:hypothetical protein